MTSPNLTPDTVRAFFPDIEDVSLPFPQSGQKQVFPCVQDGQQFVLKFMCPEVDNGEETDPASILADSVYGRAKREVAIMEDCTGPNLPKLGPINLQIVFEADQGYICFSEELIDGQNLAEVLQTTGPLDEDKLCILALDVNEAIRELWKRDKIHRDIKPGNIMLRSDKDEFILLDAGLAYDLSDRSLTATGLVPHTPGYLAPEHMRPDKKRETDNRADMFLLGIVLYEMATGIHPFRPAGSKDLAKIATAIKTEQPSAPKDHRPDLSDGYSQLVMRLLEKSPHRRYRNCDQLREELLAID